MRIDLHNHFLPADCFDVDQSSKRPDQENVQEKLLRRIKAMRLWPLGRASWDPEERIKDMDAAGVNIQVLSLVPPLFSYDQALADCLPFLRQVNDGLAGVVRRYKGRFLGLAAVPLQDPEAAVAELDRTINQLGLAGVEIGSNINGSDLDAPALLPFFRRVEALDVPVFIHPTPTRIAGADRMAKYHLVNLIGNPLETTLAVARLIFGGVLEKCPGLKLCLAHGGGTAPYLRGRWEHGFQVRAECQEVIKRPPGDYLPLLYFDTVTHSIPILEYLVKSVGADRVVLGTDYPADMADAQPVATVQGLNIADSDKQLILGGNAARILRLA